MRFLVIDSMKEIEYLKRFGEIHHSISKAIRNEFADWEPEPPPNTVVMSAIGHTIATHAKEMSSSELEAIFREVERQLIEGSESIRSAVATGLLEALLHVESDKQFDFKVVVSYLGPRSVEYCREWDRFTGIKTEGLH